MRPVRIIYTSSTLREEVKKGMIGAIYCSASTSCSSETTYLSFLQKIFFLMVLKKAGSENLNIGLNKPQHAVSNLPTLQSQKFDPFNKSNDVQSSEKAQITQNAIKQRYEIKYATIAIICLFITSQRTYLLIPGPFNLRQVQITDNKKQKMKRQ